MTIPCKCILTTGVSEAIERADGTLVDSDVGHWYFRRVVELPFLPRRGMVLITDGNDDHDTQITFTIGRAIYDLTLGAWRAYGCLSVIVRHESTPESLRERFPNWEIAWIDAQCFDEEGNFVPEEERS
jgi:hypothetical protein